jgi:hypothetical protein
MQTYNVIGTNVTLNTSTDVFTITGGATRSALIIELDFEGNGTASAYTEIGVYRVSTAGATPTAQTPAPTNPNFSASSFTAATGWTTQPVVSTKFHTIPLNSNGQRYFWRAAPNLFNALVIPGGANASAQVSFRPTTASGAVTGRAMVAEL